MQNKYLETLCLYYEEEIEGEAYFAQLSEQFDAPDQKHKLNLLARVEAHAATSVRPLIDAYDLTPRSSDELVRSGQADAKATKPDWQALLDEMNKTYGGYLASFRALEELGPAEDQQLLAFLSEHEVAAIAFLELEGKQDPNCVAPLETYLAQSPESFAMSAE